MKRALIFTFVLVAFFVQVKSQTLRPAVLVVGNGNTAFAAALQSAVSGVKTTILLQAGGFDITPFNGDINSGIQETFLIAYNKALPSSTAKQVDFNKQMANTVINNWIDTVSNLTVIKNARWIKADRSGNSWVLKLNDGRTIRPKILINPGDKSLNDALKISGTANMVTKLDYTSSLYRTSVAAGKEKDGSPGTVFSLQQFFVPGQENFLWINDATDMIVGQAAGATAAYAAFFDTKTSLVNLRKTQGELLHYRLNLMPFSDIKTSDSTWSAIQTIGVSGILKADITSNHVKFSPEKLVTTEEIKQPLKDYFYKAQIWFDDYKKKQMTISSTLEMIAYVGNKSIEQMKKELTKNWKTNYQFTSSFDLDREINRREFAVLMQNYLTPFKVNLDATGRVIR